jgi:hypothetical protein
MTTKTDRFYINCPYVEKEACKALGGKWDGKAKSWYVPEGIKKAQFVRWVQIRTPHARRGRKNLGTDLERRIIASGMATLIKPVELAKLLGVNIKQAMDTIADYNGPSARLIGTTRYWDRDSVLNWMSTEAI